MKNTVELEFADVTTIAAAAQAEARKNQWAVTIAIVDAGGHLLSLQRMDGAAALSAHVAASKALPAAADRQGAAAHVAASKARSAAVGRRDTKGFEDMINGGRTAFLSAPFIDGMLEGGLPILHNGQCIGAVGVSGVKASEDAQVAAAGIAALVG